MDELAAVKRAGDDRLWEPGRLSASTRKVRFSSGRAGRRNRGQEHTASSTGEVMQHHQSPLLSLVAHDGESKTIEELDEDCRRDLLDLAERHQNVLAGSRSHWLPFLGVIVQETEPAERAALGPV